MFEGKISLPWLFTFLAQAGAGAALMFASNDPNAHQFGLMLLSSAFGQVATGGMKITAPPAPLMDEPTNGRLPRG